MEHNEERERREALIGLGKHSSHKTHFPELQTKITELEKAHQERDREARAFIDIFNKLGEAIVIHDFEGRILEANQALLEMIEARRDQIYGLNIQDISAPHAEVDIRLKEMWAAARVAELPPVAWVTRRLVSGDTFDVEVSMRGISWKGSEAILASVHDISERTRRQEELEDLVRERTSGIRKSMEELQETREQLLRAEKLASLGDLVAGIAHEVNTPIGIGVMASTTFIEKAKMLSRSFEQGSLTKTELTTFIDQLKEIANIVYANLEKASTLINSFRNIAADRNVEETRTVCFYDYLQEIARTLHPRWRMHELSIEGDTNWEWSTHPGAWSQIISNLVINSVFHGFSDIQKGGKIRIVFEASGADLVLVFSNNGKPISPEVASRIFDPFFTTARERGGTGLGMHIVYNLVTLSLRGQIRLVEQSEGAAFEIRVPIR